MGVIVAFNYSTPGDPLNPAWVLRYPEFAAVTEPIATGYWNEATIYHANDGSGPVLTEAIQRTLLNMVTAFIAARYSQSQGSPVPGAAQDANGLVGRVSSASEGSVSVQTENMYPPGSAQFWQQNKYGADYWNATKAYRTMRYRASPGRFSGSAIYAGRSGFWPGV